jgi:hypothetical protein
VLGGHLMALGRGRRTSRVRGTRELRNFGRID